MVECPKCGHDNDLGRVFCVKCGDKLEINKVVAPSKFRRGGASHANSAKAIANKVVKVAILAAVAAVISLAILPPDFEARDFGSAHFKVYQMKHGQLENAIKHEHAVKIAFEEEALNAAMAQAVKNAMKNVEEDSNQIRLENVYISLQEGNAMVTVQQRWRWIALSAQLRAKPVQHDGKWQFQTDQVWIGHFPVPSWLPMQVKDAIAGAFKNLWQDLDAERQWVEKLQMVEIKSGHLVLSTKNGGA